MDLFRYSETQGSSSISLSPTNLDQEKGFLDYEQYEWFKRDSVYLAAGELTREAFCHLIFIENDNTRHITQDGRSLSQVTEFITSHFEPPTAVFDTDDWFNKVREYYDSFDYEQFESVLIRPAQLDERNSSNNGSWYIEGGNHRSLALAMNLVLNDIEYQPVRCIVFNWPKTESAN